MSLQQLRYLCAVVRCKLNISRAAAALGASQPAVSQQIRVLEERLGTPIFLRARNRLVGLTEKGEEIVTAAQTVLAEIANLESTAERPSRASDAHIRVVSTHPQARYGLPRAIRQLKITYPAVAVHISLKNDEKLWQLVQNGHVDMAVTTDTHGIPSDLLVLPCYPMKRSLIARKGHPLLQRRKVTLQEIAEFPLVGFNEGSNASRRMIRAFKDAGLVPQFSVTGADEDVIKGCVEEGLGVAILASIVYDPKRDTKLGAVDVTPLLEPTVTSVVVRRSMSSLNHIALLIGAFAPNWTREALRRAASD